jgi:hypothetical protein
MASHGSDKDLEVEFFVEDEYQPFLSEKEGRAIYKPVNKVRIGPLGGKSNIIKHVQMEDEPNSPSHPHRFPAHWAAFLAQQEQIPDGTPLEMCKFIPSHRVKELKAKSIHTAEQLANMPDSIIQTLGMGAHRERELTKAYLSEDVKVAELSAALAREAAMKADIDAMKAQLEMLNMRNANQLHSEGAIYSQTLEETTKRGPGRPRKEVTNDV